MDVPMLTAHVYTDPAVLDALVPQWQQLVDRVKGATVYQTPEWALAWLGALHKNAMPFGIALYAGERLVGLCAFCIENIRGVRVVRFMGGDLNDFNCVLAESAFAAQVGDSIARVLGEHGSKWDVVCLTGLDDSDLLGESLAVGLRKSDRRRRLQSVEMPTLALAKSWDAYQADLSAHRRKQVRRVHRRLSELGSLSFQLVTEPRALAEALPVFYAARTENWRARNRLHKMVAIQKTPGYWSTLTEICLKLATLGRVWLGRLELNGAPIAWDLAFVTTGNSVEYLTTYDVSYAAYSPGQLIAVEMIRSAIEQGMRCVIKGRGAQPYKYWFGAVPRKMQNQLIFANRPRARAYVGMQVLHERAVHLARRLLNQENNNG